MQIYLSDREVDALIRTAGEWCEMMGDGDADSCECVAERLRDGLGYALYKLSENRGLQKVYKKYAKKTS